MLKLNPYLNFPGTSEEAFNFYKSIFGGEFPMIQRFKEVEGAFRGENADTLLAKFGDKIMHIALPVGDNMLMATDAIEEMGQKLVVGNNHYISINVDSKEEADRIFDGLSNGGKIEMPMSDQFWGDYFGITADKFGIKWMVSFTKN